MELKIQPQSSPLFRVAIANNNQAALADLHRLLDADRGVQLAWETHDGNEAVRLCAQDTPDLILMDLAISGKNGAEATRKIMAATPCAILIVTATLETNAPLIFEALAAGALDAVDFPIHPTAEKESILIKKIQTIARQIGRRQRHRKPAIRTFDQPTLIAIGASAGGPAALRLLLEQLPSGFPAAVVIIQHLNERYADGMVEWLSLVCRQPVTVAKPGERPGIGKVLMAGTDDHMVLQEDGTLEYTTQPIDQAYRPSVDEFFASVALNWTGPIIGVILTGMGQDGARGLLALHRLGHLTLAQDEESSIVYGMPGTAARFGAATAQMNPTEIGKELVRRVSTRTTSMQSILK